jgi:putative ABC transport system permease protein
LAALVVAWLTVSYESLKAAMGNPTKSLKSE